MEEWKPWTGAMAICKQTNATRIHQNATRPSNKQQKCADCGCRLQDHLTRDTKRWSWNTKGCKMQGCPSLSGLSEEYWGWMPCSMWIFGTARPKLWFKLKVRSVFVPWFSCICCACDSFVRYIVRVNCVWIVCELCVVLCIYVWVFASLQVGTTIPTWQHRFPSAQRS